MYACVNNYVYMQYNYVYMQYNYVYMQDIYVYMQDDYVYMQDDYVYMLDNYVYIITWYVFHTSQNLCSAMKNVCSDVPSGPPNFCDGNPMIRGALKSFFFTEWLPRNHFYCNVNICLWLPREPEGTRIKFYLCHRRFSSTHVSFLLK